MNPELGQIADIAQKIGSRPEYIQGGGGNVSIKFEERTMAIKASGFRLGDLRADRGLVAVDYQKIKASYDAPESVVTDLAEIDALMNRIVTESIVQQQNAQPLRPSMEIGFHSLLHRAVIHTHSVYANILNCSVEGEAIMRELFPDALFIPYAMPGVPITRAIKEQSGSERPDIIFLENHGLIIGGETPEKAYALHEEVNRRIRERLPAIGAYPKVAVAEAHGGFRSDSPFIAAFITENPDRACSFATLILFPDQAVYGQLLRTAAASAPVALELDSGSIIYTTSRNEALAFEETFAAWAFILEGIAACGFTPKSIAEEECARLIELDSEKYRTAIAKQS